MRQDSMIVGFREACIYHVEAKPTHVAGRQSTTPRHTDASRGGLQLGRRERKSNESLQGQLAFPLRRILPRYKLALDCSFTGTTLRTY